MKKLLAITALAVASLAILVGGSFYASAADFGKNDPRAELVSSTTNTVTLKLINPKNFEVSYQYIKDNQEEVATGTIPAGDGWKNPATTTIEITGLSEKVSIKMTSDNSSNNNGKDVDWFKYEEQIFTVAPQILVLDTTKPKTVVISPDSDLTYKTENLPIVLASTTDAGSGISKVVMNLYGQDGLIKSCVNQTVDPVVNEKVFSCDLSDLNSLLSNSDLSEEGDFYLKINSRDLAGNTSNTVIWYFTVDNSEIEAPILISPADNSVVNGQTLTNQWSEVIGAVKYEYESYHDSEATNLRWREIFATTSKTATNVPDAVFYWRVRAINAGDEVSDWSPLWKITVDNSIASTTPSIEAPVLIYPANNEKINVNDFWFLWNSVPGALSYEFQSSQDPQIDENGSLINGVWVGDFGHNQPATNTLHSVGANGSWYWQVRAVGEDDLKSDWSEVWKMTIDKTAPIAPTGLSWKTATDVIVGNNGTTTEYSGVASWLASGSEDVDHYEYRYWNNIVGNQYKVGHEYVTNTTGLNMPGVFNQGEGTHYFCIIAVDEVGNRSDCSETFAVNYEIEMVAENNEILMTSSNNRTLENLVFLPSTSYGLGGSLLNFNEDADLSQDEVLKGKPFQFTENMRIGYRGPEVKALQKFLNAKGFVVAETGPGSKGNETEVFGPKTRLALIRYQEANDTILQRVEIFGHKGTGNFFWSTKQSVNEVLLKDSEINTLLTA